MKLRHLFQKISCSLLSSLAQNFNEPLPDHFKARASFGAREAASNYVFSLSFCLLFCLFYFSFILFYFYLLCSHFFSVCLFLSLCIFLFLLLPIIASLPHPITSQPSAICLFLSLSLAQSVISLTLFSPISLHS